MSFVRQISAFLSLHHVTLSAKALYFLGCPSATFVHSFVRTDLVTTISHELLGQMSGLDETCREYTVSPTDDPIRFWRSKVKVTAGRRCRTVIHVDASQSSSAHLVL